MQNVIKNNENVVLQNPLSFQIDFQKVEQHTGGKWLMHGTKHRKDNQLQSLDLPVEYFIENLNMTQRSPKVACSRGRKKCTYTFRYWLYK